LQESPSIAEAETEPEVAAHIVVDEDGHEHIDSSFLQSRNYQIRSSSAFTWFLKLSDHSRLLQYANEFRRKRGARRGGKLDKEEASGLPMKAGLVEKARLLKAIVEISRSHATPLALVLIPDGESMDPRNADATPETEDEIWWAQEGAALGIPFINAAKSAWNFARQHHVFLSGFGRQSGRGHLTRYGNDFFGREFAKEICKLLTR